jgi:hypothetical protein
VLRNDTYGILVHQDDEFDPLVQNAPVQEDKQGRTVRPEPQAAPSESTEEEEEEEHDHQRRTKQHQQRGHLHRKRVLMPHFTALEAKKPWELTFDFEDQDASDLLPSFGTRCVSQKLKKMIDRFWCNAKYRRAIWERNFWMPASRGSRQYHERTRRQYDTRRAFGRIQKAFKCEIGCGNA